MRENTGQNNSEYGHFSRSECNEDTSVTRFHLAKLLTLKLCYLNKLFSTTDVELIVFIVFKFWVPLKKEYKSIARFGSLSIGSFRISRYIFH